MGCNFLDIYVRGIHGICGDLLSIAYCKDRDFV